MWSWVECFDFEEFPCLAFVSPTSELWRWSDPDWREEFGETNLVHWEFPTRELADRCGQAICYCENKVVDWYEIGKDRHILTADIRL